MGIAGRMLLPEEQNPALMQAQHQADDGTRNWACNGLCGLPPMPSLVLLMSALAYWLT
jgi:hypothetical protein